MLAVACDYSSGNVSVLKAAEMLLSLQQLLNFLPVSIINAINDDDQCSITANQRSPW